MGHHAPMSNLRAQLEIGARSEKEGRIIDRDWAKYHTGEVVFQPKGMTVDELIEGFHWIYTTTYSTKNMLKRSFRSLKGLIYRIAANLSYKKKANRAPIPKTHTIKFPKR